MEINVRRTEYADTYTIGRMTIDGVYMCYTLEDKVRPAGVKIQNQTAIPTGKYQVIIDFSPHFQKQMLHVLNVPMFEGIRIHSGNDDADTDGCILVGNTWSGGDWIGSSIQAMNKIFPLISAAINRKEIVFITIEDTI